MASVKDPVCGMTVDSDSAADFTTYLGSNYYFCSTDCRREFEAHPERYLGKPGTEGSVRGKSDKSKAKDRGIPTPRFGSAASGGLEYERGPKGSERRPER